MKNKYNLPCFCFAEYELEPGKIIMLKYGMSGYCETEYTGDPMDYNKAINVTESQMKAMVCGSMFGWDVPGANPEFYEELEKEYAK